MLTKLIVAAIVLALATAAALAVRVYFGLSLGVAYAASVIVVLTPIWLHFGIFDSVRVVTKTLGWGWHISMYVWPIVMVSVAHYVPSMQRPAAIPIPPEAFGDVFVFTLVGAALVLASAVTSFLYDNKRDIMINQITSFIWLFIIATINERYGWQLWTVIPLIASFAECTADVIGGTQNAWNKNPTQASIVSGRAP